MKVAILSFGHVDVSVSLVKYLNRLEKNHTVDLFLIFSLNKKRESILDFSERPVKTGFLAEKEVRDILAGPIEDYIDGTFQPRIFIYQNLKLYSLKNLKLSVKLARVLRNYDLVHINGQNGVIPQILALKFRKPFVFTIHDYQPHSGEVHSSYTQNFNNWISRNRHQVIIHNRHDYDLILKALPEKAHKLNYVPFGKLDIYKSYYRGKRTDKSQVLFFGRISRYKGVEYLLEAAKMVHREMPWLKITIAGKSNYQLMLNGAAGEVELIDRYIPNEELASLVTHSDLVVCPYTDATQSAVIMTAFAFGKPVIGTRVGGIPEMIRHQETGILIEPRNAEELAQAILTVYKDESRIPAMQRNIENDQTYAWDRIAGETLAVYSKAINR